MLINYKMRNNIALFSATANFHHPCDERTMCFRFRKIGEQILKVQFPLHPADWFGYLFVCRALSLFGKNNFVNTNTCTVILFAF